MGMIETRINRIQVALIAVAVIALAAAPVWGEKQIVKLEHKVGEIVGGGTAARASGPALHKLEPGAGHV